jgi:protease-4
MIAFGLGLGGRKQGIAVVEMDGAIGPGIKAPDFARLFRNIEENSRIRAVVLDIDSPGGSATASDYLYLAITALAEKKPVVAFIRGTGASGAYLLSCAASRIIAIPSAIIGSIGVISMRPLLYEAMDRLSLKMSITKSDRFKDMGSMFRPPTDEEQAKEQALVDELFEQFVDAVAKGRKLERSAARALATGEIFTARKGLDLGLVDEIGDLHRAIDVAAELGNVARKPVWMKPRRGLRDVLTSFTSTSIIDGIAARIEDRARRAIYYQSF